MIIHIYICICTCRYICRNMQIEYCPASVPTEEYEELKKDPTVKSAERTLLKNKPKCGAYQGCFSETKWGKQRRLQKWDLMVECAPKLAALYSEVPNSLRGLLGLSEMKHSNGKFSKSVSGLHQCPDPLADALNQILQERMSFGEECTSDFAAHTLSALQAAWNDNVDNLRELVRDAASRELLSVQNAAITDDMSADQVEALAQATNKQLDTILADLQPYTPNPAHASFRRDTAVLDRFRFYVVVPLGGTQVYAYIYIYSLHTRILYTQHMYKDVYIYLHKCIYISILLR